MLFWPPMNGPIMSPTERTNKWLTALAVHVGPLAARGLLTALLAALIALGVLEQADGCLRVVADLRQFGSLFKPLAQASVL